MFGIFVLPLNVQIFPSWNRDGGCNFRSSVIPVSVVVVTFVGVVENAVFVVALPGLNMFAPVVGGVFIDIQTVE